MARFKAGESGNPSGRRKGSKNKSTESLRAQIDNFLQDNWKDIQKTFDEVDGKEKLIFLEKLLKYSIPQMSSVLAKVEYENLSENDLDLILEKLTEKL